MTLQSGMKIISQMAQKLCCKFHKKSHKADRRKGKDVGSSSDNIGKVDMAHVEKVGEYNNGMFDGDATVM